MSIKASYFFCCILLGWLFSNRPDSDLSIRDKTFVLHSATVIKSFAKPSSHLTLVFEKSINAPWLQAPNFSSVIDDETDPAKIFGINFSVLKNNQPVAKENYILTATSSDKNIIENKNIKILQNNGIVNLKFFPSGTGYSSITVTVSSTGEATSTVLYYAVSAGVKKNFPLFWHTGISDASAAISQNDSNIIVADDEQNKILVYPEKQSGLPLASFEYSNLIGFKDCVNNICSEADIEACVKSNQHSNRIFWMGSMSNGKAPAAKEKINRNIIFATDVTGTGSSTVFTIAGAYQQLRKYIVQWGDQMGYKFSKSAADGKKPKEKDGFNIEGITFGPDSTTLFICMRAPLVPLEKRDKAVIIPLLNFEKWFNNGLPLSEPVFDKPVELDLGGRGIREIIRLSNGVYIIAAGDYDNAGNTLLYKWSGNKTDKAVLLPFVCSGLNIEGIAEIKENNVMSLKKLYVVCDDGKEIYYGDATEAKLIGTAAFKKFRAAILESPDNILAIP